MAPFCCFFATIAPLIESTNGLGSGKKAVIKLRANLLRALPNAFIFQDMANHLPFDATGRPRHQS
ncbi:hypothetical protein EMIT0P258_10222 [Pseudomonas sp. IT-P258]